MAEAKPTLDALRAEIDEIDDELHRLLMKRAQVALSIGAVKNSHGPEAGVMRPSREARLLRRLAAKEDGPLPRAVGILPLPDGGDPQPWWPMMLATDPKHPRVVARLPFGAGDTVRGAPIEALVVAQSPLEETGRDRSLLVVEATEEMSRSALVADSREAKLAATVIQSWQPPSEAAVWLHLVDVEGFVPLGDKRLAQLSRRMGKGLQQIWHIGGYAVPLGAAELGPGRKG